MPALEKLRQKDYCKFKASLSYMASTNKDWTRVCDPVSKKINKINIYPQGYMGVTFILFLF